MDNQIKADMNNLNKISLVIIIESEMKEPALCRIIEQAPPTGEKIIALASNAEIPPDYKSVVKVKDESRTRFLNRAVRLASKEWILIMEEDETVEAEALNKLNLQPGTCFKGRIVTGGSPNERHNYSVRLFPGPQTNTGLFEGSVFPDLSNYITGNNLKLSARPFLINKRGPFINLADLEAFENTVPETSLDCYWLGIYNLEKKKYHRAEKLFKRSLAGKGQVESDRLAALNGLSVSLLEQHRLDEAFKIADESAGECKRQFTPWIVMHKVCWMQSDWTGAYQHLAKYQEMCRYYSEANFDMVLPQADVSYLLSEVSLYNRDYSKAFRHLDHYFELKKDDANDEIPERLFIYACELKMKQKAISYFDELYKMQILEKPDEQMMEGILEALSLVEDNGWNEFASSVYERMIDVYPGNHKILQGWLTSLIRSNQIQKAKIVMEKMKKGKRVAV